MEVYLLLMKVTITTLNMLQMHCVAVKVFQTRFIAPAKEVTCFHPVG